MYVCSGVEAQNYTSTFNVITDEEGDDISLHVWRYRPEELQKLASRTKFTRKEIQLMYRGFKQVCIQYITATTLSFKTDALSEIKETEKANNVTCF